MAAVVFCHVDPQRKADRLRLRADHLAFVAVHRTLILASGPTLTEAGAPDTSTLLLDVPDVTAARAFVATEPYIANGVFSRVEALPSARVVPEPQPGALDEALAAERAKSSGRT